MSIDDSVQSEIVDLTGKLIIDTNIGNAYNIDNIDVSQFTEMYVVSPHDDPLQNYEKVTLQLVDDEMEIKKEGDNIQQQPILQEIQVHQMTATTSENQQHNVMSPEERRELITENVEERDKTEGKHDVMTEANQEEKIEGKHDVMIEVMTDEKTEGKRKV